MFAAAFGVLKGPLGKFILAGVILLALAGAYAWVTTAAYNRGFAASQQAVANEIAREHHAVEVDKNELWKMKPGALDKEIYKNCRAAGGSETECRKQQSSLPFWRSPELWAGASRPPMAIARTTFRSIGRTAVSTA